MRTITKITTQKKNTERYNIFTDEGSGEQYAFSVDAAVLIKFGLKKGLDLDDFLYTEICYEDDIRKSYNLALQYLARRMRSELEVRKYLMEKNVDPPIIQEVILKLYDYKFLDDEQYACSFVRTQMKTTDKGAVLIQRELKDRGISTALIEKAMVLYPFADQLETAKKLCEKMGGRNTKDSERVLKQKLEQMLIRKGFDYDVISEAVSEAAAGMKNDEMDALKFQAQKLHRKYENETGFEYERKMKQALFRKGFSLEQIENYLTSFSRTPPFQ
ncbi:recombination regulator RecX [Bacillus benzoevorans]|uniref:Regulatory protein RecX n=1 Tax=Bacillus benzoevorans TaxID=1456 RepID=A0A7X0HVY9_9BACI|nr:recombination regulator RecX [Bacillus benzoevorans]MBB6447828.1 regulatory protein [Bacillus benzoevorans]